MLLLLLFKREHSCRYTSHSPETTGGEGRKELRIVKVAFSPCYVQIWYKWVDSLPPLSRYSRTANISWGASLRKTLHWGDCPFDQLALLGLLDPSFLKILRTYFKLPYKVSSQSFPFWAIYLFHISHDHSFWKIRKPIKSACLLDHTELISSVETGLRKLLLIL